MIPLKINGKHLVDIFGRDQFVRTPCDVINNNTSYFVDYVNFKNIAVIESIETFDDDEVRVNEISLDVYDRHTKQLRFSDVGARFIIDTNGLIQLLDDTDEVLYEFNFQNYISGDSIITISAVNMNNILYSNRFAFMALIGGYIDSIGETIESNQLNIFARRYQMFPTSVSVSSETYSRDAERKANYELEDLQLVNAKAKPEFTWSLIRASYVFLLLRELQIDYEFKDEDEAFILKEAPVVLVSYWDFVGSRTINAYTGQSLSGELVEYEGELYWKDFRIAFPER